MVGYTRVSTERQAAKGESLDAQVDVLRQYAAENKFGLPLIFQDAASASGPGSFLSGGDLRAAVIEARERDVPLLVARLDRLARDASALRHLDVPGLEIYSVADNGRVTRRQLHRAIRLAQREAEDLSRRARKDRTNTATDGWRQRNSGPAKEQQRSGTISNMLRADRKVNELADFLERNPTWINAGTQRLADHLNGIGLWNLISERDDIRKPWTEDSLRKPLKKSRELLVARVEDDDDFYLGFDHVELTGERSQSKTLPSRLDIEVCEQRQVATDEKEVEDYDDDPRFGIF